MVGISKYFVPWWVDDVQRLLEERYNCWGNQSRTDVDTCTESEDKDDDDACNMKTMSRK